jgi:hypothetical protein
MSKYILFPLLCLLGALPCFGKNVEMDLGVFFRSRSLLRGAPTWQYPSLMFGPNFTFFEHYKLRGPSLIYEQAPKDSALSWSLGLQGIDDDKPWISFRKSEETYQNERNFALEAVASAKYRYGERKKHYFELKFHRELIEYEAIFLELAAGLPVLPFTTFEYALALGEKDTHQYLYGTSAVSGISYHQLSLKVVLPFLPWGGVMINNLSQNWIAEGENRAAELMRGHHHALSLSTIATWKIF